MHSANIVAHITARKGFPPVSRAHRSSISIALLFLLIPQLSGTTTAPDRAPIAEALGWVRSAPRDIVEWDYVMTARVRLLFFWAGKDDVGGGYVRRGISKDDP